MASKRPMSLAAPPGQTVQQLVPQPPVRSPTLPQFPVSPSRRVNVVPVAPSVTVTATLGAPQAPFTHKVSLVPVAPQTATIPASARMAQTPAIGLTNARSPVTAAQAQGRKSMVVINSPPTKRSGSRRSGIGRRSLFGEDSAATGEADAAGRRLRPIYEKTATNNLRSVRLSAKTTRNRPQRPPEEPETFWERWWPFAFAIPPPERNEFVTKEMKRRRRERLRKLRQYDEGRDFEHVTDSNMGDSSQGSMEEQPAAPDTPAGHYSKAHPYYKKLRLPSGRRVDITRRNFFLRKWRDKKVKTSYKAFVFLGSLVVLVCLVIYAYKENLPWLYNILSGWTTAEQYDEDTTDDFDTETTNAAENGIGTRGVVFAKDDMRRRLV